jgi:transcriptional regulator with XRE-family HTH domain
MSAFPRNRLSEFREKRGLGIDQLAAMVGVAGLTIFRWESSVSRPGLADGLRLADALGTTTVGELFPPATLVGEAS